MSDATHDPGTDDRRLLDLARDARARAYAPYSGFSVGAALVTEDGTVYSGCNVENATFGLTLCAERVALFSALSDGHRNIRAMAVHVPDGQRSSPCGICRQMLAEYAPDAHLVLANGDGSYRSCAARDLMPRLSANEREPHE